MLLEGKFKKTALLVAVDICLRKAKSSPKRCARNLIELGLSAYPNKIAEKEQSDLYQSLLSLFEAGDTASAKTLFSSVFL